MENLSMTSVHSLDHLAAASICVQLKRYIMANVPDETMISEKNCVSLAFKENLFLPSTISEKLIYMMSKSELLTNTTLSLFSSKNTQQLKQLKIPDASALSPSGLKPLREHNLRSLEMRRAKFNINVLIDCLNEWTVENLKVLKFNDSFHGCHRRLFTNLIKLKNLRELDVSDTEFENHNLQLVCYNLSNLESLNISGTLVDSIIALRMCPQLRRLSISDLLLQSQNDEQKTNHDHVLLDLNELRHLDVSHGGGGDSFRRLTFYDTFAYNFKITNWPKCLPNLISLDISGQNHIDEDSLIEFLEHHPNLIFLGLMSDVSKSNLFINPKHPNYRPDLRVTGIGSIHQIALALRLYNEREDFIQTSLFNLYILSDNDRLGPRPDIIQLVTKQMEVYRHGINIQLTCTACLYNLTKQCNGGTNLSKNIPLPVLNIVVERILEVMALFPKNIQIQKNALLTLCNDIILQETKMDRFKCAEAVVNTFCQFEDPYTERLCVAVCSVVASKMSSSETDRIGSNKPFMNKLLQIIEQKIDTLAVDTTLGFALSTLWNLTDESPRTCLEFLDSNGLRLLKKMLIERHIDQPMLTKTLGLLNNIAEVSTSREALMDIDIIILIRSLLKCELIEISYFAAGILANLVSAGPASWTVSELSRDMILMELETVIMSWREADTDMVAYRSFKPFLPLLRCYETHPSQLWALWAIKHVLTVHGQRYYEMLRAEGVFDILEELKTSKKTHEHVRALSNAIFERLWTAQMTKCSIQE